MRKSNILDYQIVYSDNPGHLGELVNQLLANGWSILGYPFSASQNTQVPHKDLFCQAMVIYKEDNRDITLL